MKKHLFSIVIALSISSLTFAQTTNAPKVTPKKLTKKEQIVVKSGQATVLPIGAAKSTKITPIAIPGKPAVRPVPQPMPGYNQTHTLPPATNNVVGMPASMPNPMNKPVENAPAAVAFDSGIEFEKEVYDYGTVEEGPKVPGEFKFWNRGKEPIIIANAVGSCGCTVPTPPKEPIMPGQSNVIKVEYNTQGRVGQISKQITVTVKSAVDPSKTQTKIIKIAGNVVKPVVAPEIAPNK